MPSAHEEGQHAAAEDAIGARTAARVDAIRELHQIFVGPADAAIAVNGHRNRIALAGEIDTPVAGAAIGYVTCEQAVAKVAAREC